MKQAIMTRLFMKQREGVQHVGFIRQQRFYPVPGAADGVELLVTEIAPGSPVTCGEYSVKMADGATVRVSRGFGI